MKSCAKVNIAPVKKMMSIACVGTYHDVKEEGTQTLSENLEVTDRVLDSCFKCRSYCGVPLKVLLQARISLDGQFLENTGVNILKGTRF